ncbi:PIR Superfamily Protein, partial [Plasmodium ovale curtisi]
MSGREPDIYSFFKEFEKYKGYEAEMNHVFSGDKLKTECDSYLIDVQKFGNERANDVCVKFKILCKVIESKKKIPNTKKLNDIDFAFLNYWLNSKLRHATIRNNLTVQEFQDEMSYREWEFGGITFDGKLYDLQYEDFNNMNL